MAENSKSANTDGTNSPPSPFSAPQINLPKGGGAIRGIGEKFTANAVTGTGSLSIPIAVSPARSGFTPQLSLAYDSGAGNGAFGIGWSLATPAITRKTDKGLPQYRDHEESDVFILSGAEDLVPLLRREGGDRWVNDEFERDGYRVKPYRPRIEGLFARIERWTRIEDGDIHWRSFSKDDVLTFYGSTRESRICDPADERHIFSWLISASFDGKGNAIVYEHMSEDDRGVDLTQANERNRVRTANRYLKRILYGNRKPLRRFDPDADTARWMFEVVFDYGDEEYCACPPDAERDVFVEVPSKPSHGHQWPAREDPFSSYRSGFEVRTYRLCQRVLLFHHFPEELDTDRYLVQSTELEYNQKRIGSFITRATQSGYTRESEGRYLKKSMPALELEYSSSPLENDSFDERFELKQADARNLPEGIDGSNYRWLDLDGVGISGVLSEEDTGWYYKRNLGKGRFGTTELVSRKPSIAALASGHQQLLDIAGDGNLDLVDFETGEAGFYERTTGVAGWEPFRPFRSLPVLEWDDPNLKFVDVTGDGIADVLVTEDLAVLWHPSYLREGFGPAVRIPAPHDENQGPRVVFDDGTQSIYLADMSGDGLSDIVRIRNGEVCYWPNLGYGRFGPKVTMDGSPWFDRPDLFDQKRIRLADTDGSGTSDILYLGAHRLDVYLNQSGNRWSSPRALRTIPTSDLTSISVTDFLGRGTACVVWSSPLPADSQRPLRYVDLMRGLKPHLLIRVSNNLGAETAIEYAASTEFYLADEATGQPWITRLPFPVHVVKRVETYDYVSRNRFVSRKTYHHGYFDGVEREFRGFGRVEQLDTEELGSLTESGELPAASNEHASWNVPPILTKTWFHTGVFIGGDRVSRHLAHEYYREPHETSEMLLDDTILPGDLTPEEAREACRALKGSMLRQEVYALDGVEESQRPYTASESNFTIRPLQAREWNRHAVFFTHARESVTFNYERKLYDIAGVKRADPRVTHAVTLLVDEYGNVLKALSIGYGRRFPDNAGLPSDPDRRKQEQILLTLTDSDYTNPVRERDAYRNPLPSETRLYELTGMQPEAHCFGVTNFFRFEELERKIAVGSDGHHDLPFEDMNGAGATGSAPYRRLFQRTRTLYRSDNLDRLLPSGRLEALALPGEVYQLAFTPGLIRDIYRRKLTDQPPEDLLPEPKAVLGDEGGYVDLDGDGHWWIPTGRLFYSPDPHDNADAELAHARKHFFSPRRYRDPLGNTTTVTYDVHNLVLVETRDAAGNITKSRTDYRVLAPKLVTDVNGNRTAVSFDSLGMLAGTALMGKEGDGEGDSLEGFIPDLSESTILAHVHDPLHDPQEILCRATTRLVYDLFAFVRTQREPQPQPAVSYTLARETHESDLAPGEQTKIQHTFSYSDGFGRISQKKVQAEPGPLVASGPEVNPRWVGTGWTIFNNKGKPVRQYEPFFSTTQEFEFANIVGVSSTLFYDSVGRAIATLHPEHTYEKVVFDPWQQVTWDVNDTVLEKDPASDRDVGGSFRRLPEVDYLPTWYVQRRSGGLGPQANEAAEKAAVHARTPKNTYLDTLARTFLTVDINRFERGGHVIEERIATSVELDIEGQPLSVTDALGRRIMSYDYDMVRNRIHQSSADAGDRWTIDEATGKPLRMWDSRDHQFRYEYDVLRRQTGLFVQTGVAAERLAEKIVYGEGLPNDLALNLRGKSFRNLDGAGIAINNAYDFKGNLLNNSRQLLRDYREDVDWSHSPELEERIFTSSTTYDALNRPVTITAPDASVIRPRYNEANLLDQVNINLRGADVATPFVTNIAYNAKAQRELIEYGNGARTCYSYDPLTFRLTHLETRRKTDDTILQDLNYTHDPIGNITSIADQAQQRVYFDNQVVTASNDYVYDSIYRLIGATGRELIGLFASPEITWDDSPRMNQPLPGDGQAMRRYKDSYEYDVVGNILEVIHHASPGWSRRYHYPASSNRLESTRIGEFQERYAYDANGNMIRMPHLPLMSWDFKNQLHITREQVVNRGEGRRTFYVYDSAGTRVRKVTQRSDGSKAHERVYLGGFEVYREYSGKKVALERETLHVMDDKRRVALAETKTVDSKAQPDSPPSVLIRYQFTNHLESSCLELDEEAAIISYEEYYPYGSTSLQSVRKHLEVSPKRYRYTGRERDQETGLYYQSLRYYASWLGRWASCDPAGLVDGTNLYRYARNNPLNSIDRMGLAAVPPPSINGVVTPELGMTITGDSHVGANTGSDQPAADASPAAASSASDNPAVAQAQPHDGENRDGSPRNNPPGGTDQNSAAGSQSTPTAQKSDFSAPTSPAPISTADSSQERTPGREDASSASSPAAGRATKSKERSSTGVFSKISDFLSGHTKANKPWETWTKWISKTWVGNLKKDKQGKPDVSWTKWIFFGIFVGIASLITLLTHPATAGLSLFAKVLQTFLPMVEGMLLAVFGHKDLVNKPKPGSIDSKPVDRWSFVHTLAGVVLSLLGVSFPIVALLTVAWEAFEITVHGFGDEEINANRITDILVAWGGWFFARALMAIH